MQQKVPFARIRLLDAVAAKEKAPFVAVWTEPDVVCSEKVTFDPLIRRPVDLFEKEPRKGNSEVHLHTATKLAKIRQRTSEEIGNKHTHKRCSNYTRYKIQDILYDTNTEITDIV